MSHETGTSRNDELEFLRERVERLEAAVGDVRTALQHCLAVAEQPEDALTLARRVVEGLTKRLLEDLSQRPPGTFEKAIRHLESPEVMSRGAVPNEIVTVLHMVRVIGNKAAHDALRIQPTSADVDLVLRSVLRVVEWYFGEFERGPKIRPLFRGGAPLPPLPSGEPPPAVPMPPVLLSGPEPDGAVRKVFLFTDRLLGLGREKTSRDSRVHIVSRLLPCPDASHPNWNRNLENISRLHAQLWWQLGRTEIRDENSDKGVFVNDRAVAPGIWTSCSFPDPAHVKLGPQGLELGVAEIVRRVDGAEVSVLKLTRLGNWPYHEYLLLSRPLASVGSDPDSVAWFPGTPERLGSLISTGTGWSLRTPAGDELPIEAGAEREVDGSGVTVKRVEEEDFLS